MGYTDPRRLSWDTSGSHSPKVAFCVRGVAPHSGATSAGFYLAARALGLGAVGRKVDLTEQAIRRGEGQDPALGEALARHDAGDYE